MELLKSIRNEWAVISQAPFSFLILAVLMFAAAYFAARWRYTAIIDQAKASRDALSERLHLRSDQTESYREKAAKYDETVTAVIDSGASELKDRTLKLVGDLREFITRSQHQEQMIQDTQWVDATNASSEEEKRRLWSRYGASLARNTSDRNSEYSRRFKAEAMILRDELRSRLPDYKSGLFFEQLYDVPTNFLGFTGVADDLELMAKSL